jgi:methionyl-tRNA synthetase
MQTAAQLQYRYITTPIYYVNDRPHIGHCYTTLVADGLARFARLRSGNPASVFFLTGTDEHADKVVTTAAQHGLTPIAWADKNAAEFAKAFAFIQSSHDDFIRTTQDRHKTRVVEYVTALMKSGAIYKGSYEGWYDENQEEYLTETVAKEADYKSPVTGRPLVRRSEVCYFFRLSTYQDRLQKLFAEQPNFVSPAARRNEVLGRLRDGLHDVPISRPVTDDPATQFGIRVPGDDKHRIYVWIDALFNYLSVVDTDERRRFWPAQIHLIAKDILWFHAVIWPAMLMALRESDSARFDFVTLPRMVYSHAYWVREGRKMSKSLGNFVTIEVLEAYATQFGLDALRWYLLTQGPLHETDADFSHSKFVEVYNSDLANGIGNCASRVANMVEKYFDGHVPAVTREMLTGGYAAYTPTSTTTHNIAGDIARIVQRSLDFAATCDIGSSVTCGLEVVRVIDGYINATRPFSVAKTLDTDTTGHAKKFLEMILAQCAEGVRIASILLSPAMPTKMAQLWETWGCTPPVGATLEELCAFAGKFALKPGQQISKGEALFMRADPAAPPPSA